VTSEFENEDPAAPIFFLSYWRPKPAQGVGPPREATRFVTRFFDDLTADVNDLIGSVPGRDPGFLDVAGDGGVLWRRRLLHAVGTCHVLATGYAGRGLTLLTLSRLHQYRRPVHVECCEW
jgi:hypothetical protein